ncbi:hypothetical protein [Bacillus safensis]|uniref:hypothetical protein n=1 Tax=Bacillus TaxID=1386 RepID=UPI00273F5647|nr:hypothetical protein [Bacillus safensis]
MNYYSPGYRFYDQTFAPQFGPAVTPQSTMQETWMRQATFTTRRITLDSSGASGNTLLFFIETNSTEAPIVTLADNNGFPSVLDFYAKATRHAGMNGMQIHIRFDGPARGRGFAINIAQPGMHGDFRVIPLQ